MNPKDISKFLSLVLRHDPGKIGISLDENGWTDCRDLIAAAGRYGRTFDYETLVEVVRSNDKQRFSLSDDGEHIRANQGHSVTVDLALEPQVPPAMLYHGTVPKFLESIRASGLCKGERHHVHLSADRVTASKVGERRGKPVILSIRATEMSAAGHSFYVSENGVWLTDAVPPEFIDFP